MITVEPKMNATGLMTVPDGSIAAASIVETHKAAKDSGRDSAVWQRHGYGFCLELGDSQLYGILEL